MRNIFLNSIFVTAVATGLAACGVGVENDDQATAQQRQDAKALNARFDRVRGTYEGTFTSPDSSIPPHPARLLLYPVSVTEGANPDGTLRVRPALYGRFQLVGLVGQTDYISMRGDYDELGTLNMSSVSSSSGAGAASGGGATSGAGSGGANTIEPVAISVLGNIGSGAVDLTVSNTSGTWGHFAGTRTSDKAAAPSSSDAAELRSRLLAVYREIEGTYTATIDPGSQPAPVSLTISIAETGTGGSAVPIPYLVAQYRRLDFPAGIGERQLAVNYDQLSSKISMNDTRGTAGPAVGATTGPPGSGYFLGAGSWVAGKLDVTFRDRNGFAGELNAVRKPYRN